MNTKELESRVQMRAKGRGQYEISIEYRGEPYKCHSTESIYYDIYKTGESICGYTYKQALQALYDICKCRNRLGEFK